MTIGSIIHITAGTIGLLSGFFALATQKGKLKHRQAGKIYLVSMVIMTLTGALLAYQASVNITVLAGLVTFHLVITSWLTIKRAYADIQVLKVCSFLLGLLISSFGLYLSVKAYHGFTDMLGEFIVPAGVYYFFTGIVLFATSADFIAIFKSKLHPKKRMIKHIWRMCVSLYIACSSFFDGQQQVFPEQLHGSIFLSIPQFSVLIIMIFWIVKVWFKGIGQQTKVRSNAT